MENFSEGFKMAKNYFLIPLYICTLTYEKFKIGGGKMKDLEKLSINELEELLIKIENILKEKKQNVVAKNILTLYR